MRARIIPADKLKTLSGKDWVDRSKRPYVEGGRAWVPVKEEFSADCILERDIKYSGPGYQMIGDIAVIHGTKPKKSDLDMLISWKNPSCVLYIKNYNGIKRIPDAEILYGNPGEVCHRENKIKYILDPSKVMFAMGNREEKKRIYEIVRKNERTADMFAGIGYFTIPAALSGSYVHAMEINSESFGYLLKNIKENRVLGNVCAECGDCRDLIKGIYDRVLMGHFDSVSFLPEILPHMKSGGTLHVHTINGASDAIEKASKEAGFEAEITVHNVKKYAPHRWHVVQDVVVS